MSFLKFADTDLVVPVQTKKDDKFVSHTYKLSLLSDFPELGISIDYGVSTTLTPEQPKPGYKTKGIKDMLYRQLLQVKFDRRMQATYTLNPLLSEHISDNDMVYVFNGNERKEASYVNHRAIVDGFVLPTAQTMMLNPQYKSAQYSSWLYVGLSLLSLVQLETKEQGDGFHIATKEITADSLKTVVIDSLKALQDKNAYVSDSHALIANKLQAALPASTTAK